jgi:glycosyltransferase involved in cell wall biosynthesis
MARIGIDAHVLDGKHQGSRTWLANTLAALGAMAGAHRWVIYSANPERTAALFPSPAFEHRRIGARGALSRLLWFWPRAARRDRLDALLTQYIAPPGLRIASFVVIHDLLFESDPTLFPPLMRWRLRLLCRISARRAAAILTVSRHAAGEIHRRYAIPPERIHLAPNGVAPPVMADIEDDARAAALCPYVLCVGRLEPRKNIGLALAASEAARAGGARLVVVGRADFRAETLVRALRTGENVVHIQDASDSLLAALYRHAAALIYPSIGEGFGIPVIEALGYGTAVIASDRTAIPETGGALAAYFDPLAPGAVRTLGALIDRALAVETRPDPEAVAAHLAQFDWSIAARALLRAADAL